MSAQTANLFLLEDLEDVSRTRELAESDLDALRAVADWLKTFVVRPHKDLGRAGAVCPFVPGALERKMLWLAPEHIADQDVQGVVELMSSYKSLFLDAQPTDGDDSSYKVVVVVFTDLSADRAQGVFGNVLQQRQVRRTQKMESCSGRSTKATRGPQSTTQASDHSNRRCRFCS
jgi:Domain of unknown function (DUF6875)